MNLREAIRDEPSLPRRNGELVFAAPWESRAFSVAVALSEAGVCAWDDFRARLIAEIGDWTDADRASDDADWDYYGRWLAALERLLVEDGVVAAGELDAARERTAHAAAHEHDHEH